MIDENKQNKQIEIKMDTLLELKNRAQSMKNVICDEKEKKIFRYNKLFIERFSEINIIIGILYDIYMKGYPKKILVKVNIKNGESTYKVEENIIEYKKLFSELKYLLNTLTKVQLNDCVLFMEDNLIYYIIVSRKSTMEI